MATREYERDLFGETQGVGPYNYSSRALENACRVKAGTGFLYGFTVTNTKASSQFVQVFDARDVPADGAVPLIAASVASSSFLTFAWIPPRRFEAGLILCNSSTQGTKTIGSADCIFDAQYL